MRRFSPPLSPLLRVLPLSGVLLLAACATSNSVVAVPGPVQPGEVVEPQPAAVPVVVALTAFDDPPGGHASIGAGLAQMLAQSLVGSGRYSVQPAAAPGQAETAALSVRGRVAVFEPQCQAGAAIIVSDTSSCVGLDLRIADGASGKLLRSATVDGASANSGTGLVYATGPLPGALAAYAGTPAEPVIRNCVEAAARAVVAARS